MIEYEDGCVGCPPELGCLGDSCPNRKIIHTYCDCCGEEEQLYWYEEEQLCKECITEKVIERLEKVEA